MSRTNDSAQHNSRPPALAFTGERVMTSAKGESVTEHLHRYALALRFCAGKDVLDIASGEGYGSTLLSSVAKSVTGVDISADAVDHANRKYSRPNLRFVHGSCESVPLADASVDVVVSFETIEHHDKHEEMMREIRRILRKDGLLVISSPDRVNYSEKRNYRNPFHVRELDEGEFRSLLGRHFKRTEVAVQKVCYGSLILVEESPGGTFSFLGGDFSGVEARSVAPMYFVALASDGELPRLDPSFFDAEEVLQRRFNAVFASKSYRLGHAILAPFRWFGRMFGKKH